MRSRRLVHALMAAGVFLAAAGLYRLENAGYAGRTLNCWEYWFRDTLTVAGRYDRPDDKLAFLGIDSTSVSLSPDLDLKTLYSGVAQDTAE